ncbi:two pore domain potassium channel family protein [Thermobifida halotolerans]|uniref:Two pore domain potassium channel family protein n=1 Tax=Thermobifida halotolerans TaxID=483545 RepID=A0AA97M4Y6_9ACTN|nr:potassium channel family protein [Thermobifida halotolerans]UOE20603.1 two pore domain potassium channel family protein [Thermobifida halotolerans]
MAAVAFAAGVVILLVLTWEVFQTALVTAGGGGPVTGAVTSWLWRLLRRAAGGSHRLLSLLGPAVAFSGLLLWVGAAWLGWWLVFLSGASVEASTTGHPADAWERCYFVGYTLTTLGNGEFRPTGPGWQLATVLTSATGLTLATLILSYLVSLVSAVVQERSLAVLVHALGERPERICARAWNGDDFTAIVPQLNSLNSAIAALARRHTAYPVLSYFHSRHRAEASAPNLAVLDEALTLMCHAVPPDNQLRGFTVTQTRAAIAELVATGVRGDGDGPPPVPSPRVLDSQGIPTVDPAEFERVFRDHDQRRSALAALLRHQGWDWKNVHPA